MADKDCHEWTLSVRLSQWEQPELFSRRFQDSKYVCEKNVFFGGRWSDFPTKLMLGLHYVPGGHGSPGSPKRSAP